MGAIRLLDCTLRDGGYVNDWRFGEETIREIVQGLEAAGIDILEVGFLKNEPYQKGRTVFNSARQISPFLAKQNPKLRYAAMVEVVNPLPLGQLEEAQETDIDIIRVIVWKRMLKEGLAYCRGIVEKGYQLCVQPARVDQYTDQEFVDMVRMFNSLGPHAVYVVDSWGTQSSRSLLRYMRLADENLADGVSLGYHGHNNLMQAFQTAVDFINADFQHGKILDASIYGIGRGAGNLNLELIAHYMNGELGRDFKTAPMVGIYSRHLADIYARNAWGFSMAHYITAVHNCNPDFGAYYSKERKLPASDMDGVIAAIPPEERIIYTKEKADRYERQYFASARP